MLHSKASELAKVGYTTTQTVVPKLLEEQRDFESQIIKMLQTRSNQVQTRCTELEDATNTGLKGASY